LTSKLPVPSPLLSFIHYRWRIAYIRCWISWKRCRISNLRCRIADPAGSGWI